MWPGFESQTWHHITWIEFVGSLLCSARFSKDLICVYLNLLCPQLVCLNAWQFIKVSFLSFPLFTNWKSGIFTAVPSHSNTVCDIMRFMEIHNRHHKVSHSSCIAKLLLTLCDVYHKESWITLCHSIEQPSVPSPNAKEPFFTSFNQQVHAFNAILSFIK